ncbi:hypothetical protein B0O99DRAFT_641131 [Bisporella sp. PMI_857]|nr:hypothetical protein B0O99DRAFT_641131 [Bisporella sp. PMI_857]
MGPLPLFLFFSWYSLRLRSLCRFCKLNNSPELLYLASTRLYCINLLPCLFLSSTAPSPNANDKSSLRSPSASRNSRLVSAHCGH